MIKQIKPSKIVYDIAADCVSTDKIHVCVDSKKREYIILYEYGAWRTFTFGKTCGYDGVLTSQSGVIDDFVDIISKYTALGWEFYELDSIKDLINWFAKRCMVGEWEIPDKPAKNQDSPMDETDEKNLMREVRLFLKERRISQKENDD